MTEQGTAAPAVAEILAALAYGERLAQARAERNVELAPDAQRAASQRAVAEREAENARLIGARLAELGSPDLERTFAPFFEAFFERTEPTGWAEAQAWHYIGDALVRDFADALIPALDEISARVVERAIAERDMQESFALDELTRLIDEDPPLADRVAAYARRVIGEALTQTQRALARSGVLRRLLGGFEGEKRALLDPLERHRARLDRLGIEIVD